MGAAVNRLLAPLAFVSPRIIAAPIKSSENQRFSCRSSLLDPNRSRVKVGRRFTSAHVHFGEGHVGTARKWLLFHKILPRG